MLRLIFPLIVCAAFLGPAPAAHSAPIHDFNAAVFKAYGHYREALFYLRGGNVQVASFELEEMTTQWKLIVGKFADTPPDVFSADPAWRQVLLDIDKSAVSSLEAAINNDAKEARKLLAPVRGMLSALRRRNGVINFSDYVDQANAAFDKLWVYRSNPPDVDSPKQIDQLRRIVAVTAHLYEMVQDNAPTAVRDNPEFKRLMGTSLDAFRKMRGAITARKVDALISILRGQSSSNRMLFLRFG